VEESKLQHQKQLQQGKRLVEVILRGLATDMVLHLDDVQWDEDFDVRAPLRGIGTATTNLHRLGVRVGQQWQCEDFSSEELADLPGTKEMRLNIKRRLTDLLRRFGSPRGRIGF
jgi:hypothetical protein